MSKFREIPACQYHSLCGGWCEDLEQARAGLCENCLDADLQDECSRMQVQLRVAVALRHIEELAEQGQTDSQVKTVALALVNQLVTLGHLNAATALPYLQLIQRLDSAHDAKLYGQSGGAEVSCDLKGQQHI